jgi:branched chain amino acid efflux pump
MAEFTARPDIILLICAAAIVTYMTRIGGHLILSRFRYINPRVESALEAVPAAVITAIVVPPALSAGPPEVLAILFAGIAALRFGAFTVLLIGLGVLVAARNLGL